MRKTNVIELSSREKSADPLTDLIRQGARKLIEQAIEGELAVFMDSLNKRRLEDGRAAVVRNGYQPEREIQTGIGPLSVKVPKVRAKDDQGATFRSALVPPYVRKTRSLLAALPWMYLKGISTGVIFLSRCRQIVEADVNSEIGDKVKNPKFEVAKLYRIYALSHHNFCNTGNVEF